MTWFARVRTPIHFLSCLLNWENFYLFWDIAFLHNFSTEILVDIFSESSLPFTVNFLHPPGMETFLRKAFFLSTIISTHLYNYSMQEIDQEEEKSLDGNLTNSSYNIMLIYLLIME